MGRRVGIQRSPATFLAPEPTPSTPTPAAARPHRDRRHQILLGTIIACGLLLRFRDALAEPLLPGTDPYRHLERTWDLMQGKGIHDYPLGFSLLLSPLTILGPGPLYFLARVVPPFFGAASLVGIYLLGRRHVGPEPALIGTAVLALMPEHILRTNLLVPTALDLAVLPFVLLLVLDGAQGNWRSLGVAGLVLVVLMVIHPWVVMLVMPPFVLFGLVLAWHRTHHRGVFLAAVGLLIAVVVAGTRFLPNTWNPVPLLMTRVAPNVWAVLMDPRRLFDPPPGVDYFAMVTLPALILCLWGAALALRERNRFVLLILAWASLVFPLTLVDWFGVPFMPQRAVVYLAIVLAALAMFPARWFLQRYPDPARRRKAATMALGTVALLMLPYAYFTPAWHQQFDENDAQAWTDLTEKMEAHFVVTTSEESRSAFRAMSARAAVYDPAFFNDTNRRQQLLKEQPQLFVLVDRYAETNGLDTSWLYTWQLVGRWGDVEAFMGPDAAPPWYRPGLDD